MSVQLTNSYVGSFIPAKVKVQVEHVSRQNVIFKKHLRAGRETKMSEMVRLRCFFPCVFSVAVWS